MEPLNKIKKDGIQFLIMQLDIPVCGGFVKFIHRCIYRLQFTNYLSGCRSCRVACVPDCQSGTQPT
jgi:hypothetical protein